jgi:hypothetical protein
MILKIKKILYYILLQMHIMKNYLKNTFLNKNVKLDLLVDDGPHALECMKPFINLYSQTLADD